MHAERPKMEAILADDIALVGTTMDSLFYHGRWVVIAQGYRCLRTSHSRTGRFRLTVSFALPTSMGSTIGQSGPTKSSCSTLKPVELLSRSKRPLKR